MRKKIVDLREIYNKKCNFSFCFAKQKGYNNNYIHILDSVSFKSAFLVHARGTQGTLRYWNICDASFENGSSNIWNIDAKSDLTARLSYILWNWVILTHQRKMYLSNQTALMFRLNWSFTFHICPKTLFAWRVSYYDFPRHHWLHAFSNQNGQVNYPNE